MPLLWSVSMLMILYLLLMLIDLYFYKNMEFMKFNIIVNLNTNLKYLW